eukprot:1249993-Amphidinium_carterae.1
MLRQMYLWWGQWMALEVCRIVEGLFKLCDGTHNENHKSENTSRKRRSFSRIKRRTNTIQRGGTSIWVRGVIAGVGSTVVETLNIITAHGQMATVYLKLQVNVPVALQRSRSLGPEKEPQPKVSRTTKVGYRCEVGEETLRLIVSKLTKSIDGHNDDQAEEVVDKFKLLESDCPSTDKTRTASTLGAVRRSM